MNAFITQQPSFSLRMIKQPQGSDGITIGVAVDSSHFTQQLYATSWCFHNGGIQWDHGISTNNPYKTKVNDTVSLTVNLQNRTLPYIVNGNATGPPTFMSISDSQFQLLRPIVQFLFVGCSVEIYP